MQNRNNEIDFTEQYHLIRKKHTFIDISENKDGRLKNCNGKIMPAANQKYTEMKAQLACKQTKTALTEAVERQIEMAGP